MSESGIGETFVGVTPPVSPTLKLRATSGSVGTNVVFDEVIKIAEPVSGTLIDPRTQGSSGSQSWPVRLTDGSTFLIYTATTGSMNVFAAQSGSWNTIITDGTNNLTIYAGNIAIPNDATLRRIAIGLPSGVSLPVSAQNATIASNVKSWVNISGSTTGNGMPASSLWATDITSGFPTAVQAVSLGGNEGLIITPIGNNNLQYSQDAITGNIIITGSVDQGASGSQSWPVLASGNVRVSGSINISGSTNVSGSVTANTGSGFNTLAGTFNTGSGFNTLSAIVTTGSAFNIAGGTVNVSGSVNISGSTNVTGSVTVNTGSGFNTLIITGSYVVPGTGSFATFAAQSGSWTVSGNQGTSGSQPWPVTLTDPVNFAQQIRVNTLGQQTVIDTADPAPQLWNIYPNMWNFNVNTMWGNSIW